MPRPLSDNLNISASLLCEHDLAGDIYHTSFESVSKKGPVALIGGARRKRKNKEISVVSRPSTGGAAGGLYRSGLR
jgi:hypothetical protein